MFQIPLRMVNFETRITYLDHLLSKIANTNNRIYKFVILSLLHYGCLTLLYISIFFTTNRTFLSIILLILLIQVWLNIKDNGCFLMKLERKYIGKQWYGPYSLLNIIVPNTITPQTLPKIFKTISILSVIFLIYKLI